MPLHGQRKEMKELVFCARQLRERLWADPHRPRFHFLPPEGHFNDANGMLWWKGRYHVFYLARTPIPDAQDPAGERWSAIWDHASSEDLIHWIFHPPAVRPATDGSTPRGIFSGDAIDNAPGPTLIYHVPAQGTCIATAEDDELIHWTASPANPVIAIAGAPEEAVIFDPCAWREGDAYCALIGNRNRRPGYEGDSTSLFRSTDLVRWEYRGPFYKSERRWTDATEDCACPDFFPIGRRHMLLMHGHRLWNQCHYYLGHYADERFHPEMHGRMTWPGGQLCAPETLLDGRGRRIFFGWIREERPGEWPWQEFGWSSVMSLPRELTLGGDGELHMAPVEEIAALRRRPRSLHGVTLESGSDIPLSEISGEGMELGLKIEPGTSARCGLKVRCSPDGEEQTPIVCDRATGTLRIELARSTQDPTVRYPRYSKHAEPADLPDSERYVSAQEAPFVLGDSESLRLRIFVDRSVLEVFANGRQSLTQRIYPTRKDSLGVRLFAEGGSARVVTLEAWDMAATAPW